MLLFRNSSSILSQLPVVLTTTTLLVMLTTTPFYVLATGLPIQADTEEFWYDYGEYAVDVGASTELYVVSHHGSTFQLEWPFKPGHGYFRHFDGTVSKIAAGAGGKVYGMTYDGHIYYTTTRDGQWTYYGRGVSDPTIANGGYATDIGVDPFNSNGAMCYIGKHTHNAGGPIICNNVQLSDGLLGYSIDVMRKWYANWY